MLHEGVHRPPYVVGGDAQDDSGYMLNALGQRNCTDFNFCETSCGGRYTPTAALQTRLTS